MLRYAIAGLYLFVATMPALAQSTAPDILGLRLGMTWAEAKPILMKHGQALQTPLYTDSVAADSKAAEKYGYPYQVNVQMAKGNESINVSLYPKSATGKLSDPNSLIVHRIRRTIGYEQGKALTVAATYAKMTEKYGPASEAFNQGFQTLVSWLPRTPGNLTASNLQTLPWNEAISNRTYKCYSTPDVYGTIDSQLTSSSTRPAAGFDLPSWSGWQSCGLVVRAIINADRSGLVQTIIQDLLDFKDYDIIIAAKKAAEQKIKSQMVADSIAAAPKQEF
jgi:hypothetical protein